MTKRLFFITAIALAAAVPASAELRVRDFKVVTIARPHGEVRHHEGGRTFVTDALPVMRPQLNALQTLKLYPSAGTLGRDVFIPYFVDLDTTPGEELDFRCSDYTFDGHTGHDPYIRSFREQEIGMPVFSPLDATVLEAHDGELDQNTSENPNARSNF